MIIENEYYTAEISKSGGELIALINKGDGSSILWEKDETIWNRVSPVLFPIIGALKNNCYTYNDTVYEMSRHGFLRDQEFQVEHVSLEKVILSFTSNDETLKSYPFKFKFTVTYWLDEMIFKQDITIKNIDDKEMYYSFGLHPGFKLNENGHNSIIVENIIEPKAYGLSKGLITDDVFDVKIKDNKIEVNKDLFLEDTVIVKTEKELKVELIRSGYQANVVLNYSGFDHLAFWQPHGSLLCIEPWAGVPDHINCSGQLREKIAVKKLAIEEVIAYNFSIKCY